MAKGPPHAGPEPFQQVTSAMTRPMLTGQSDPLARFAIFAALEPDARAALARKFRQRTLEPGEMLLSRDDVSDEVYFIATGTLRILMYSAGGKVVPFRDLGPGETIGELAALDRQPRSASVECCTAAEILLLDGASFRDLVAREASVANALLRTAIAYVRDLSDRLFELRSLDAPARIALEIVRHARLVSNGGNSAMLSPAPRHSDIADRAGSHREAVARFMSKLARAGLVERRGRALLVRDIAGLTALANTEDFTD